MLTSQHVSPNLTNVDAVLVVRLAFSRKPDVFEGCQSMRIELRSRSPFSLHEFRGRGRRLFSCVNNVSESVVADTANVSVV